MLLLENLIFTYMHKIQRLELSFPADDVIILKAYCRSMTNLQYSTLNYKDEKSVLHDNHCVAPVNTLHLGYKS
jgi:hypothetical protein